MKNKILLGIAVVGTVATAIAFKRLTKKTSVNVRDILNSDDDDEYYGLNEDEDENDDDVLGITEDYLWDELGYNDDDDDDTDEEDDIKSKNSDVEDLLNVDEDEEDDEEDDDDEEPEFDTSRFYKSYVDGVTDHIKLKNPNASEKEINKEVSSMLAETFENSIDDDIEDEKDDTEKYIDMLIAAELLATIPDMVLDIECEPETGIFVCTNNGVEVTMPQYDSDKFEFIADFDTGKLYGYHITDDMFNKNTIMKCIGKDTLNISSLPSKQNSEFIDELTKSIEQEENKNGFEIIRCFDKELLEEKKEELRTNQKVAYLDRMSFILNATYETQEQIRENEE